jgi:hypothetical protein
MVRTRSLCPRGCVRRNGARDGNSATGSKGVVHRERWGGRYVRVCVCHVVGVLVRVPGVESASEVGVEVGDVVVVEVECG